MKRCPASNPTICLIVLTGLLLQACEHEPIPGPATIRTWEDIPIKAIYEVPAPAGRTEEGDATLELLSNNSLAYTFHIHNFNPGDVLTNAHIHFGDAGTSGPVLINLNPQFTGAGATGVVENLRQGQVDTLLNMPVYINVHSAQVNAGVARGQLDKQIAFAMDVSLNGSNEVPDPIATTATGLAVLRLTSDNVLYSKVTVDNLESNDTLTASHIHRGAAGANGGIRVHLCGSEADFGVLRISAPLHDSVVNMIKSDPMYVNVHSKRHGPGLIRGQIR